ncbi:TonB-dependent receptor [uncultured Umboniibacter sp.]|uniref:TonB-dependent receptor n=1 Tax=uncultured Umboniibacter sp. TaxID=1798917 RepID=UPI0026228A47|nr:TonB-dependent receptor [uncultured Umboniibacter sp.]
MKNFKRARGHGNPFQLSLLTAAIAGIASGAIAQDTTNEEQVENNNEVMEEVVVSGVRRDLLNAQAIKRDSATFVDAISAEDAGRLPDRSVIEAISRLPGVAMGRFEGADDPDHFGVEGSGVVIRGLTHVRSEFNGRDAFKVNGGRGLSFQDVPPELMANVQVFKNSTADMIEGGISGTVNLVTRKPLDNDETVVAFSLDSTYADFIEESTPSYSGLFSSTWESDIGTFGLLVNYSKSELKAQSDGMQVGIYNLQNNQVNGEDVYVPRGAAIRRKQDDRERTGGALVLQWESPDEAIVATAEYLHSDSKLAWTEYGMEMDDGADRDLYPVAGSDFSFDNQGYFESGVITSEAGWRGNDADRQPGGRFGMQHNMVSRWRENEGIIDDYSFNLILRPTANLEISGDLQYVEAETNTFDFQMMGGARSVVGLDVSGSGLPTIDIFDPAYDGGAIQEDYLSDPRNNFHRSAMDHVEDNDGTEFASRLDLTYSFDSGFVTAVKVGARTSKREQTVRYSTYNWGVLSEAWTGSGNTWYDDAAGASVGYDQNSFDNFGRGGVLNIQGGDGLLFPDMDTVMQYPDVSAVLALSQGWAPLNQRDGVEGYFLPTEINEQEEMKNAAYVRMDFATTLGGMELDGNLGLRYIEIETDTKGFLSYPDFVADPNDPNDPLNFLDADQAAFGDGTTAENVATGDYSGVLPSLNMKLSVTDDSLVRFGLSKAIALPDLDQLSNHVSVWGDDLRVVLDPNTPPGQPPVPVSAKFERFLGDAGNPFLKPMESINYDLSYEWYFADDGNATASLFYKDLSNYFINGTVPRTMTNNGSTQVVQISAPTNGESGKIYGFELNYQQFYDWLPGVFGGLGMSVNYANIQDKGSPNGGADTAFDDLPLEGLSEHNFNVAMMYEKYDFSGRLAYNWRSEYLLTSRDVITTLPIYNADMGYLDASLFYDISENFQVGVQATNLLDTAVETKMQINQEGDLRTRSWFVNDRRYSFVFRATF